MEDPSVEHDNICRKMHSGVFNRRPGEEIDLHEVMNDAYKNIISISKFTIAQLKRPKNACRFDLSRYSREVKFFITFFRCALKWCVGVDGIVINESLVHVLTEVELYFFDIAECLLKYYPGTNSIFESTEHMVQRVAIANAYLIVFYAGCLPSNFMISEESVLEFLNRVLMNLDDCEYYNNQIETLRDKLRLLRNYLLFSKDRIYLEKLQELLVRIEAMVDKAACYSFLSVYWLDVNELFKKVASSIELEVHNSVLNVLVLELDSDPQLTDELLMGFVDSVQKSLGKLLNYDAIDLQGLVKDQLQLTQEVLRFVVHLLFNILPKYSEQEKVFDIRMRFLDVARDIGCIIISSLNNDMKENTATDMGFGLFDLLQKVKLLKEHVVEIILPVFLDRSGKIFPQTDHLCFLDLLLENIKELMDCKSVLLMDSMDQVEQIYGDLVFFRSFLQNVRGIIITGYGSKDISSSIMNVAYEAESLTNTFVVRACPVEIKSLWISDLMEQIKLIKASIVEIVKRKANADEINVASKDPSESISHPIHATKDPYQAPSRESVSTTDVVVGLEV